MSVLCIFDVSPNQDEFDKLAFSRQEMESKLCKMTAHNEELEEQCQLTEVCHHQCVPYMTYII